jgi:rod shape-determining protein MreD
MPPPPPRQPPKVFGDERFVDGGGAPMIMPRSGDQLLLPANPFFVWGTLFIALMLNLLPLGRVPAMPDLLALTLVFWNVHQARRVGVGAAFVFGLLMDVHDGAVLGQHALAYTLLSYFAITIHRRLLWFSVGTQALQILPLFVAAHAVSFLIRLLVGGMWPGWTLVLAPVLEALLWPLANMLLLAPQRRAPDRDENRPL